jgi:chorismate-pyruvate lyase
MAASAELKTSATDGLPAPLPSSVMWLPASALNCYEGDEIHREWLLTPGLLTQRIRAAAADQFSMRLLNERRCGDEFVREIDMSCDNTVWLFAHTRIPVDTAKRHDWLTRIGERTLG